MKLIKYENYTIDIAEEAYLVGPIRKLYMQDKTKSKDTFFKQMSLLYFIYDPRSNYAYISDESLRREEVETQEGINKKDSKKYWTKEFEEAIKVYKKLNITSSLKLLNSTRVAIDKLSNFLETVDLEAVDEKGKPKYAVNSITNAIKQIPQLAKDLAEAEKVIAKEMEEQSKARGNSEMSLFDSGINL